MLGKHCITKKKKKLQEPEHKRMPRSQVRSQDTNSKPVMGRTGSQKSYTGLKIPNRFFQRIFIRRQRLRLSTIQLCSALFVLNSHTQQMQFYEVRHLARSH